MTDAETHPLDVIALRRELHAHPELAFLEVGTSALVRDELGRRGWTLKTGGAAWDRRAVSGLPDEGELQAAGEAACEAGRDRAAVAAAVAEGTACIATRTGNRPGPDVALRFDMDALPIHETDIAAHAPARLGFRSRYDGRMHACGHDGNVAVGVALGGRLSDGDFPGTVSLVFQPGEEGVRGAAAMLAATPVDGVERMWGLHLGNGQPACQVAGSAVGLLATAKLRVRFTGRAAHAGSAPELGRNAILAAATATLNLHALPRFSDDITRVNVGTIHGGTAPNIIAERAELELELRAGRGATLDALRERVSIVVDAAAAMHGCSVAVDTLGEATSLEPDASAVDLVLAAAADAGARDTVPTHNLRASDDFSLFAAHVQHQGGIAAFALVGGGNRYPHHTPEFDIDEACLPLAVDLLERLVRRG